MVARMRGNGNIMDLNKRGRGLFIYFPCLNRLGAERCVDPRNGMGPTTTVLIRIAASNVPREN